MTFDLTALGKATVEHFTAAAKDVPAEVKTFVDGTYKMEFKTGQWRTVNLGSEDAVKEMTKLARAYCKDTDRTFMTKALDDKSVLACRVSVKVTRGTAPAEGAES